MEQYDAIITGGGAAGFFGAIRLAERCPDTRILIVEKTTKLLSKVKVSGGGRCNVTHACFDNRELVKGYPRGGRELLGCFHKFNPADIINWFEKRGVELKTEKYGIIFPVTDNYKTVIDCIMN
jgi:predicted flavoprotein YhiN